MTLHQEWEESLHRLYVRGCLNGSPNYNRKEVDQCLSALIESLVKEMPKTAEDSGLRDGSIGYNMGFDDAVKEVLSVLNQVKEEG